MKKVHFIHNDGMPACGKPMGRSNGGSALWQDVTCQMCKETLRQAEKIQEGSKALAQAVGSKKTVTLYTLAPATLDKPGTESVGSYWLYKDDNIPEQALREVIVPQGKSTAQWQLYSGLVERNSNDEYGKIPYITFTEVQLGKALAQGIVYRSDEQVEVVKAMVAQDHTANQKEVQAMPAKKKAVQTPQEPFLMERVAQEVMDMPTVPAPSALDAILAQPIVAAAVVKEENKVMPMPEEREEKVLAYEISMQPVGTMPIDLKALAQEIIAALKAEGLVMAQAMILPPAVEPEIVKDPDIWDILGDGTGAPQPVTQPAKPRSTLKLFTTPKAAEKTVRASSGKTDPAIVKAIQTAWRSGKVTQAAMAEQYGMDEKKVWYFCNRAKQL